MASGGSSGTQLRRRTSISLLSNEQVRTSVVRELVQTERDFVKVMRDVAEGYIAECRRRTDMFTEEQIETIFINLEQLLDFQSEFLKDLETCIDWNAPHKSCVGECFLNHVSDHLRACFVNSPRKLIPRLIITNRLITLPLPKFPCSFQFAFSRTLTIKEPLT